MKDKFIKEFKELLNKHGVETCIAIIDNVPKKGRVRFMALGSDSECKYASLFEKAVNISPGFRGILKHVNTHSKVKIMSKLVEEHGEEAVLEALHDAEEDQSEEELVNFIKNRQVIRGD